MINKKAVELNVATIIIVILAILVLVILAFYFTGGMKGLWSKITPIPSAYEQTDLETARSACTLYCSAKDETTFCTHDFDIRKKGETKTEKKFCDDKDIGATKEPECIAAGFDKLDCKTKFPERG
ncbi:MAG: hypothetical protein N3G19_00340 [Candidatus Pacearchaeota archaeon]|nr:hypothetical protein [Candidatus Pacearchaeota archaeon]